MHLINLFNFNSFSHRHRQNYFDYVNFNLCKCKWKCTDALKTRISPVK